MKFSPSIRLRQWLRPLGLALTTAVLTVLVGGMHGWSPIKFLNPAIATTSSVSPHSEQLLANQALAQSNNGQLLLQRGREYYAAGQFSDAVTVWLNAAIAFKTQNDSLNQSVVLSNLALAYRKLGELSEAEKSVEASFNILESINSLNSQGLRIYGQALNTQGSIYLAQGQNKQALDSWEKSTEIYEKAEYSEGVIKSLINQTYALRNLGFFNESRHRLLQVKALLDEETNLSLKVTLTLRIGETERLLGDFINSEKSLREIFTLAETASVTKDLLASTYLSLGNTLQARARQKASLSSRINRKANRNEVNMLYEQALGDYQRALEIYKGSYTSEISDGVPLLTQVRAELNQFDILVQRQNWTTIQYPKTIQSLQTSLMDHVGNLPLGRSSAFIHMRLARLLTDACMSECPSELPNAKQHARKLLTDAQKLIKQLNDPIAESYVLGYLGHLDEIEKSYIDAQELTKEALQKGYREPNLAYQWEWQLGRIEKGLQYDRKSILGHYSLAFQDVQKVRNDLLHVGPDVQFDFRDRIEPLYREYIGVLLPKEETPKEEIKDAADAQLQLRQAQFVIDDLRVAELESFLACGLIEPDNDIPRASIQEVAKQDEKTAIIYPIILPDEDNPDADRLEVLIQLPNKPIKRYLSQSIESDNPSEDSPHANFSATEEKLEQFRKELEQPYFSSKRGKPLASEIYDWLIWPAEEKGWLSQDSMDTLVFVLDGAFRNVPMAALYDEPKDEHSQEKGKFLIEKYAIAVTFGDLQLPQSEPDKTFSILAAGLSEAPELDGFGPLPFVQKELDFIRATVPNMDEIKNKNFTQESLEKALVSTNHNVLHLATHGEFGTGRENTFIVTTPPSQNSQAEAKDQDKTKVDSKIDLNELNTLFRSRDLNPIELLVLSACETATGDNREVLGIAGIAVQTGARTTLASLWNVDDSSTAELMQAFYQELVESGVSRAEALRKAQLHLIQERPSFYRPSHWAPYVIVGDWR